MNHENTKLLTVTEAAKKLCVSPRSVRRWAAGGSLPSVRIGNNYRFAKSVVQDARTRGLLLASANDDVRSAPVAS